MTARVPLSLEERMRRAAAASVDDRTRLAPVIEFAQSAAEPAESAGDVDIKVNVAWPSEPLAPGVSIIIEGPPRSGQSVIAHLIRAALAREGIAAAGPDGLRSIILSRAIPSLIGRGLRVTLSKSGSGQ